MTPHRRRRAGVVLALALLVPTLNLGSLAGADPLAEKRAEAARIARQLEEQSRRVSLLAEDFDEARVQVQQLDAGVARAESRVARTDDEVRQARDRLRDQVVDAYMRGGAPRALEMLVRGHADAELAVRHQYVKATTDVAKEAIDGLREAQLQQSEERDRLEQARSLARDAVARADAARREAGEAEAAQRETLARVQGELATLVAAETRRRAEEEARRVQAELARREREAEVARREREAELARRRREAEEREREAASRPRAVATTTTTTVRPPAAGSTPKPPPPSGSDSGSRSGPAPPPAKGADAAVAEARRQLGKPYEWGGSGPDSFDCSGLTSWAWRAGGKSLSHSSRAQFAETARVPVSEVQPGDLLFYGDPIHHVGIYSGNGQMIEASQTGTPVRYASIYRSDLVGVGRIY